VTAGLERAGRALATTTAGIGLVLGLAGCGGGSTEAPPAPASAPAAAGTSGAPATPDPSVRPYCDAITRVQAEQSAPGSGGGGVLPSSDEARRQVADLVATAPPEIAAEWRTVQQLTEQALSSLAETGGDPTRIDRAELERLQREATPAVTRIQEVTQQRCGITFRPPG
jgi:hypothetical protein